MQTDLIVNKNLEMASLLGNKIQTSTENKYNESDSLSQASRSKNSSETVLVEKDQTRKNKYEIDSAAFNQSTSPMLNGNSNLAQNIDSQEIDVEIIDPRKTKKTKQNTKPSRQVTIKQIANPVAVSEDVNAQQQQQQPPRLEETMEEIEDELILKYGAAHVIKLFIPVTICLIFVIISLSLITSYQKSGGATLLYTPFNEDSQKSSTTKLWMSVANASIFICVVVIMTIILILLYKFRCYKIIHGWLAFSSLMLLFFFTYMFIGELFKQFNLVTDMLTVSILLWNFGIVGMACIHWKGPLILQQVFLIFSCVQMALIFIKYLPEWTTWVLLAFISIWDLIAVLCPFGPLRILVETARTRNDNLFPAMVYSSTIIYTIMANIDSVNQNSTQPEQQQPGEENLILERRENVGNNNAAVDSNPSDDEGGFMNSNGKYLPSKIKTQSTNQNLRSRIQHGNSQLNNNGQSTQIQNVEQIEQQQDDDQENGIKLGLGDFIFYSILVGKASILGDWNTVIACFIAILIGLCFTLVLLAIYHKPLPALPISLLFGLIFYFSTNLIIRPFYDNLTYNQFFI